MELICIGTGSKGNSYALKSKDGDVLLIEAGVPVKGIIKTLKGIEGVVGCIVTHEHQDHAGYASQLLKYGIRIYCSAGTKSKIKGIGSRDMDDRKIHTILAKTPEKVGAYMVMPFHVLHDAEEPYGYLIYHKEVGTILFATDTRDLPQTFTGVSHWIVECNYVSEDIERNYQEGVIDLHRLQRTKDSHMSLETLEGIISRHADTGIKSILLIHLSDTNSNEDYMVWRINEAGRCPVTAVSNGTINKL